MKLKIITFIVTFFSGYSYVYSQTGFTESAKSKGLNFSYGLSIDRPGTVTFCDFNQDGWDDLTFTTKEGDELRFFQNNEGVFEELLIPSLSDTSEALSANWVDMDNDGDLDFFLLSLFRSPRIYRNEGSLFFTDVTMSSGLNSPLTNGSQGCWGDVNNDSYLDLFVITRQLDSLHSYLYLNNGDFTFDDVTETSGILDSSDYSNCAGFLDYDNDNDLDIFISNDKSFTRNRLLENDGLGNFTEVSEIANVADSISAMSVSVGDYNNDGHFDIYVTNTFAGNYFLKNHGDGTFSNVAPINGTAMEAVGWGAQWLDGDNNGWNDLYVSGGLTPAVGDYLYSAYYEFDYETETYNIPTDAGFDGDTLRSYVNAMGDLNNDGFVDLVIHNLYPDSVSFYENDGNDNNWLKVNTTGTISNRDGIGSRLTISTSIGKQYEFTMLGEAYNGQNSFTEFFGLDTVTVVDTLTVQWQSGHIDTLYDIDANQTILVVEGQTVPINSTIIGSTTITCEEETTLLVANGAGAGETYLWSNGETTDSIYVGAGTYTLTIENAFGFTEESEEMVIVNSAIEYELTTYPDTCGIGNGGAFVHSLSSNVEDWTWHTGEIMETISDLGEGSYTILFTDTLDCEYTITYEIENLDAPEIELIADHIFCFGENNGGVLAEVTGYTPFEFNWSTEETTEVITELYAGWYFVTITDVNGCSKEDSIFVEEPEELEVEGFSSSVVEDLENGIAWVTVEGGTPGYTYLWNDSLVQTTDTAYTLPEGVWEVTVTDANGCINIVEVEINEVLGITDEVLNKTVKIYPNPTDGLFTVNMIDQSDVIERICIYALNGKEINCFNQVNGNLYQIDQMQLIEGAYILKVETKNGTPSFSRLIIQK